MIKSVKFKRFKSFKAEQTLELRPITVIIGKNNSGKSAVLKLLRMLQHSINEDRFKPVIIDEICPLIYHSKTYKYADKLKELVYLQTFNVHPISLDLSFEGDLPNIKTEITDSSKLEHFEKYSIGQEDWLLEDNNNFNRSFDRNISDYQNKNLFYFDALRPQIQRWYEYINSQDITYQYLINLIKNQKLLNDVQSWYQENLNINLGFRYQDVENNLFSIYEIKEQAFINLADVGEGIAQTLPLVIQTLENQDNALHIIEQPELHLHPAAHANMAQLFANAVKKNNTVKFVIETHSENFILRLRTLCAKCQLLPSQIKLYFIEKEGEESNLKTIEINEMGEVNWWPENVFSEAADEVMALRMAQFAKNK